MIDGGHQSRVANAAVAVLAPDLLLTGAADEEVLRVPDRKARQKCLARQYSGDAALPAGCKFP
jgi:hypothetical protein